MRAIGTALALWMISAAASAQWTVVNVSGTPSDVEFTDAGVPAVATSTGSFFIVGGGGAFTATAGISGANMVSAYRDGACDCATNASGQVTCCATTKQITPANLSDNVFRVRHSQNGRRYISFQDGTVDNAFGYSPGPFDDFVGPEVPCGSITAAIDGLSTNTADWGVMALGAGSCGFSVLKDGLATNVTGFGEHGLGAINEVDVFEDRDGGITALAAHGSGASRVPFTDGGTRMGTITPLSGIPVGTVTGIAFNRSTGDEFGDGFGMAIVAGTEDRYFSPIPDPENPAVTWVERTISNLGAIASTKRVTCFGAATCAAIAGTANTSNVFVYENTTGPSITVPTITLDETQLQGPIEAQVSDDDGDPVFVRWFPDAGSGLTIEPSRADGTQATVTRDPGLAVCGSGLDLQVRASASDGLAGHTVFADGIIRIDHTVPPGVPSVTGPERVASGSGAVTLTANPGTGVCPLTGFQWTPLTTVPGADFSVAGSTTTATFLPPQNLCAPDAPFRVQVTAEEGSLLSAPVTYTLVVEGWGPPNAAFPAGATATQPSGLTALYSADGGHPCDATAGVPNSQTVWTLVSSDVPGATLMNGGAPATGPVTAEEIGLFAPDCSNGTVVLGATQQTGTFSGPDATLTVQVETTLAPVQTAEVALTAAYDAGVFRVTGEVGTDLNCEASRALTAEVEVLRAGAPLGATAVISVPGSYSLPVQIGCGGGDLEVVAEVIAADGGRSPEVSVPFTAPVLPAAVGTLDGGVLQVACGEGARGAVSTRFEEGQCPLSTVQWTQLSGPALATPVLTGTSVSLQTASTGLDGLIGETVTLAVEANAGDGNVAQAEHSLVIEPAELFVALEQQAAEPIAEEGGILRLSVVARNQAACGVSEVALVQRLAGGTYLPGSARLDGVPVEATVADDTLTVPGVRLEANATRLLTYSVRPRLLGDVRPEGQAFVKGYAVSAPSSLAFPNGGCACGSAPGGAAALGVLLLLRALRRRR